MAVGQSNGAILGLGAPSILVYVSGDWDVHWGYGLLTYGHMSRGAKAEVRVGDTEINPPPGRHPHHETSGVPAAARAACLRRAGRRLRRARGLHGELRALLEPAGVSVPEQRVLHGPRQGGGGGQGHWLPWALPLCVTVWAWCVVEKLS